MQPHNLTEIEIKSFFQNVENMKPLKMTVEEIERYNFGEGNTERERYQ